jgi:elongator complex protein 3
VKIEDTEDIMVAFKKLKREYAKSNLLAELPSNTWLLKLYRELLKTGDISRSEFLESVLKKRGVRSQSGIVPIQVLTKPFRCPGKCIFCPNDATMPKSYINTEPGAMRALLNNFDPYKQAYNRLLSLYLTGHATDKIEMIVLWWTRDVYPTDYKRDFLKWLYDACNTFELFMSKIDVTENSKSVRYTLADLWMEYPATIEESMKINETAEHRIIWLTIETRPEYMTDENCQMRRSRWVTRLEMGLQSMFDDVLDANIRGHSVQQAREAVHKMRQYGFKFSIHFMPGLYGSTVEKDIETFRLAYNDPWLKPDEIKFYPTSVIPNTPLYDLYKSGEYIPLDSQTIMDIIKIVERKYIPPYTRIKRLIRDIPETEIVAWSKITNLRQLTEKAMLDENRDDASLRKLMYDRLYPFVTYCETMDEFLRTIMASPGKNQDHPSDEILSSFWENHLSFWTQWRIQNTTNQHLDATAMPQNNDLNDWLITTYVIWKVFDPTTIRNFVSLDTRAREMRHRTEWIPQFVNLVARQYASSMWQEFFVSFEDELWYIYGFARLLLPDNDKTIDRPGLWKWTALIRELHVYGQLKKIQLWDDLVKAASTAQHKWFGSQLMAVAEKISHQAWYQRLSVISGIGVKEYYKKLGYVEEGTYVVKVI